MIRNVSTGHNNIFIDMTYILLEGPVYHDAERQDNVGFEEQRSPLPSLLLVTLNIYPLISLAAHLLHFIDI